MKDPINQKITLTADTGDAVSAFERLAKSLEDVVKSTEKTAPKFKQANSGLDKFRSTAKKTKEETDKAKSSILDLSVSFNTLKTAMLGVGIFEISSQFLNLSDRFQSLSNRILVSSENAAHFNHVMNELVSLSNETGTSLENNAILFQRLAIAADSLGATTEDMLGLTKTVANLGRLSGSSVEDMKNATRQLAQALGNSKFQAEEFNSVVDQMPAVISEIAREMKVLPFQIGEMVRAGNLLTKDVYEALLRAQDRVNEKAKELPFTLAQSKTILENSLIVEIGKLNQELGVTENLGKVFRLLAENADDLRVAVKSLLGGVVVLTSAFVTYRTALLAANAAQALTAAGGLGLSGTLTLLRLSILKTSLAVGSFSAALGPVGIAVLAIGAAITTATTYFTFFGNTVSRSKRELEGFREEINTAFTLTDIEGTIKSLSNEIEEVNTTLARLRTKREEVLPGSRQEIDIDISKAEGKLESLLKLIGEANERYNDINSVTEFKKGSSVNPELEKQQKAYERIRKQIENQRILAREDYNERVKIIVAYTEIDENEKKRQIENAYRVYQETIATIEKRENAEKLAAQKKVEREKQTFEQIKATLMSERQVAVVEYAKQFEYIKRFSKNNEEFEALKKAAQERLQIRFDQIKKTEDAEKNALESKIDALKTEISTERELLTAWYEEKLLLLEQYGGAEAEKMKERLELLRAQKSADIDENEEQKSRDLFLDSLNIKTAGFEEFTNNVLDLKKRQTEGQLKFDIANTKSAISAGKNIFAFASGNSKKIFEIQKSLAIADAVVATYGAVNQTLKTYGATPWGYALAAGVAAAGFANVSAIRSTEFGSGGGGAKTSGTTSSIPSNSSATPTQTVDNTQSITISVDNVDDDGLYSGKMVRAITEEIAKQIEEGVTNVRFA